MIKSKNIIGAREREEIIYSIRDAHASDTKRDLVKKLRMRTRTYFGIMEYSKLLIKELNKMIKEKDKMDKVAKKLKKEKKI